MENKSPQYDPHIIPAETAAREEREQEKFLKTPNPIDDQNQELNNQPEANPIDTTEGYTVDKEGLLNNYAIEPEMYVNEPGDLREKEAQQEAERAEALANLKHDRQGELSTEQDNRGKGQGLI